MRETVWFTDGSNSAGLLLIVNMGSFRRAHAITYPGRVQSRLCAAASRSPILSRVRLAIIWLSP